jgi:hypothetical protein
VRLSRDPNRKLRRLPRDLFMAFIFSASIPLPPLETGCQILMPYWTHFHAFLTCKVACIFQVLLDVSGRKQRLSYADSYPSRSNLFDLRCQVLWPAGKTRTRRISKDPPCIIAPAPVFSAIIERQLLWSCPIIERGDCVIPALLDLRAGCVGLADQMRACE